MPRALSQLRDTLLVACLAALSCLPPSGWKLCVGADGHWAIEPTSIAADACCDDPDSRADTGPGAAAADDCSDCTDYALTGGLALGSRFVDDGDEHTGNAPCVLPAVADAPPVAMLVRSPAEDAVRPERSALTFRSTILRC